MITPKHKKQELTQKHVVQVIEAKRKEDISSAMSAKHRRSLVKKSIFPNNKRKW